MTLVELLVALGLITLLMGLLLPALQRVRAAADRLVCASQFRQIGLALHHFHADNSRLPEGVKSTSPFYRTTWLTQILPYIEQDNLWQTIFAAYTKGKWSIPTDGSLHAKPMMLDWDYHDDSSILSDCHPLLVPEWSFVLVDCRS